MRLARSQRPKTNFGGVFAFSSFLGRDFKKQRNVLNCCPILPGFVDLWSHLAVCPKDKLSTLNRIIILGGSFEKLT